jgi:glycosyltransferase involved in cell wall biosynthesis
MQADMTTVGWSSLPVDSHCTKRFSIIVPVHNGAETIRVCLSALVNQEYPRDCFEIIVVNDGSTDRTPEMAKQFPVKVIDLPRNEGRLVARQVGAKEARYDILVFNDVRVIPEPSLLKKLSEHNYFPLMPDVVDYDGSTTGYSRLFYLLRRKIYYPNYPLFDGSGEILIDCNNFDKMPKGTTNLACPKSVWLAYQPEWLGKHVNDDTRILFHMVESYPLLRTPEIRVKYLQRTSFWSVMRHMYGRGPRFADYYLIPGGRFFTWYLIVWALLILVLVLSLWAPSALMWAALAGAIAFVGFAVWLSKRPLDFVVVLLLFPPMILAFGLGILRGQIFRWGAALRALAWAWFI